MLKSVTVGFANFGAIIFCAWAVIVLLDLLLRRRRKTTVDPVPPETDFEIITEASKIIDSYRDDLGAIGLRFQLRFVGPDLVTVVLNRGRRERKRTFSASELRPARRKLLILEAITKMVFELTPPHTYIMPQVNVEEEGHDFTDAPIEEPTLDA